MFKLVFGDKPSIVTLLMLAAVLVVGLLVVQMLRRATANKATRRYYNWAPFVLVVLLSVGLAYLAYDHRLELTGTGNTYGTILGYMVGGYCATILPFVTLFGPGKLLATRLPMTLASLLAAALTLAGTVYAKAQYTPGGFIDTSAEMQLYKGLLTGVDWLSWALLPYLVLALIVGFITSMIRRIRRKRAAAAAPTSPAAP